VIRDHRCHAEPRGTDDDAGTTLIEIMVTMGIMSILMVIFTGAILQVYRASSATESLSTAQSQLQLAFQRTDKEIRYASWIGVPGKVGTAWYVEFAGADATKCGQLRLAAGAGDDDADAYGVLQLIRWTRGTPPAVGVRGQTLASQLVTNGANPPFVLQTPGALPYLNPTVDAIGANFAADFQRLRIQLTSRVGGRTTQADITFTALNTSHDTSATNNCSEGRPTS